MLLKKLEELADEKEIVGNKTRYHFSKGVVVKNSKVDGIFLDIIKEDNQIVLFDGTSPFARIIKEDEYSETEVYIDKNI